MKTEFRWWRNSIYVVRRKDGNYSPVLMYVDKHSRIYELHYGGLLLQKIANNFKDFRSIWRDDYDITLLTRLSKC